MNALPENETGAGQGTHFQTQLRDHIIARVCVAIKTRFLAAAALAVRGVLA